jgi:secreted Zn-dependent insulinase-like peptidase
MPQFDASNIDQLVRAPFVADEFDVEKTKALAAELCKADKLNVYLRSKSFEGKTDQTDEWFKTKYIVEDMSEDLKKRLQNPNCDVSEKKLDLPPANTLIPKSFDLLQKDEARSARPILLKKWPDCTDLWYKKDDHFGKPKEMASMQLYTNDCLFGQNPRARVFVHVWQKVLEEHLGEFTCMAAAAKLSFDVTLGLDSVNFKWSGYGDSVPGFVEQTLTRLCAMKGHDLAKAFAQVKEKLLLDWKNCYFEQSYQQAIAAFGCMAVNLAMEKKQMRKHLESFTYEDF